MQEEFNLENDFKFLLNFLPEGWAQQAKKLGALTRCRKIPNAEILLRVLLIHLAEGCSLRETAVRAKEGGIISLSDVAIMDRLKKSTAWFQWMNTEIMKQWITRQPDTVFDDQWNVRLIDGTAIKEPGPTGSSWRIHYSINLPSLCCDELLISNPRGKGESFKNFTISQGDLLIGDRAYGVRPSIFYVKRNNGDLLTRFALSNLPLLTTAGKRFDLLKHLRTLGPNEIGDWDVAVKDNGTFEECTGRVCAIKKSSQAAQRAMKKVKRQAQKHGIKRIKPETLESSKYIFVFTTVARTQIKKSDVLEMYRGRWQIELVFKRLKSIMGLGHLRKNDKDASMAWLQGKLFVAFVVEALISQAETFFPWGYPICKNIK
ncbi:IS4 family transposase [bacterium]|nr:IS4 family transposase [bacterium]